jgi:succinate-semialdehyde dehydrogenase / glutarate-semialdehyde dehydrogenase
LILTIKLAKRVKNAYNIRIVLHEKIEMITTINPATSEILKEYSFNDASEIENRLDSLHLGWKQWKALSFNERGGYFRVIAQKLLEHKEDFARLVTVEMGKPINMARAEIEKCAWTCEYFSKNAEAYLQEEIVETSLKRNVIHYQPMGVILGIMPWNFPFWQVFRAVSTSVMAGNVFLLKHAPISTGVSLAIEALFQEVVPFTIFHSAILDDESTSALISHKKIAGVTLTGSIRAGRSVAEKAGKALKKCVLELGGSDPYIILADADLDKAAELCVKARLANSGQICIAPKRIIIVESIYQAFREKILSHVKNYQCGDPLQEDTLLGPMAREDLRDLLIEQIEESIQKGATLAYTGTLEDDYRTKGFYYPPTVLENVTPGMPAFDDELFGPVIELIQAKDEADAIRLANLSSYGLGAGIFTQNIERGEYLATEHIEAGACQVNGIVSSDPRMPFGGVKASGLGYELGVAGIREFVHIKTIGIV